MDWLKKRHDGLTSEAFFLQLHSKRYDQYITIANQIFKTLIAVNGGGIAILISAKVFNFGSTDFVWGAMFFLAGTVCALTGLTVFYLFSSFLLGTSDTYRPLRFESDEGYESRLRSTKTYFRISNLAIVGSTIFFVFGVMSTLLDLSF